MTPAEAWARLAGVDRLERFRVIVDANTPLARPGWIGILRIGGTVTVVAPRADLVAPLTDALADVPPEQVTDPAVVLGRVGTTTTTGQTLGPAQLYFPPAEYRPPPATGVEPVSGNDLDALLAAATEDELDESGVAHHESPTFGARTTDGGVLAAIAGYRRWRNGVAHLSVLTHPDHRNKGHARRAAAAAIASAIDEGLLPQWRARVAASQHVALALGFEHVGGQLGLEPTA